MKVHRLYRPENIPNIKHSMLDLNLVYWSDESKWLLLNYYIKTASIL